MTNKEGKRTVATTIRKTRTPKTGPTNAGQEPRPFRDPFDYLEAWFALVEPGFAEGEAPAELGRIPSFDRRLGYLHFLAARTAKTIEAGVDLPFERYAARHELDVVDRLVLLALLRATHDPVAEEGLFLPSLLRALGADSLSRQHEVLSRLEIAGRLRDLGAVHCYPNANRSRRLYRLAPWLAEPLTTGGGSEQGLPEIPVDPNEAMHELRTEACRVVEALGMDPARPNLHWQVPAEGRSGWDHVGLRRLRLLNRLEASARNEACAVGAEIRRLGLVGQERLAWAFLLHDAQQDPVGVAVPLLVRFSGRVPDPEAAAARLLGPSSKLGAADCVRFNRADGPFLARVAWLSREASARVVPWPRDAFSVRTGADGEPVVSVPRAFGFDNRGAKREDRAATAGGGA